MVSIVVARRFRGSFHASLAEDVVGVDPPNATLLNDTLPVGFFSRPALEVARDLIGVGFFVDGAGGTIVETEAYAPDDPASHSYRGPTASNATMFVGPGISYVYRSYGLHWCFNVVCEKASAVLLRALEPTEGVALMRARRGEVPIRTLCGGPGNLSKALGITAEHNGLALSESPFSWSASASSADVVVGPRIGISKAIDAPWRFGMRDSSFLSRRF